MKRFTWIVQRSVVVALGRATILARRPVIQDRNAGLAWNHAKYVSFVHSLVYSEGLWASREPKYLEASDFGVTLRWLISNRSAVPTPDARYAVMRHVRHALKSAHGHVSIREIVRCLALLHVTASHVTRGVVSSFHAVINVPDYVERHARTCIVTSAHRNSMPG